MSGLTARNPYRPGAATQPLHLAGRESQLSRFKKILLGAPELPANLRLTGLRGVGKSVLLKELEAIAKDEGWIVVRKELEPRHNSESELASLLVALTVAVRRRMTLSSKLKAKVGDAWVASRGLVGVTVEDVTFTLTGSNQKESDLAEELFRTVEQAVKSGHQGFVLLLDEAQVVHDEKDRHGDHPLSMLVAAINALQEKGLPIALVLCGLPTLRANLQRARTYSERMFKGEIIGALQGNPGPARDAFVVPLDTTGIKADEDLIDRVLQEVEGYPYFIQLWGAALWEALIETGSSSFTTELLDAVEPLIYARLDEDFYAGRVDTLTPSEQDLLMDTADCPYPPLKTADIRSRSNKSDGNINVLMGRLTDQGVIYREQKGTYMYTAPKFDGYLRRRVASAH